MASQVVVLSSKWAQRDEFVAALTKAIAAAQTSMMPYVIAGLIYWVFNFVVVMVLNRVEKRMNYYHD